MRDNETQSFTTSDAMLITPINNFEQLSSVIRGAVKGLRGVEGLKVAIKMFTAYVTTSIPNPGWDFYKKLVPKIQEWAQDARFLGKQITVLPQHCTSIVTLEEEHVRHMLANGFFGYIQKDSKEIEERFGTMDFYALYRMDNDVSVARIMCLLSYFYTMSQTESTPNHITFQRVSLANPPPASSLYTSSIPPDWGKIDSLVQQDRIRIT